MSIKRIRNKITAINAKNQSLIRVTVFRSNRFVNVIAIDDVKKVTLFSTTSKSIKEKVTPVQKALKTGEQFGKMLKDKKITKVVFDRNVYKFHGQVKNIAEGIRKAGIKI